MPADKLVNQDPTYKCAFARDVIITNNRAVHHKNNFLEVALFFPQLTAASGEEMLGVAQGVSYWWFWFAFCGKAGTRGGNMCVTSCKMAEGASDMLDLQNKTWRATPVLE